MRIFLVTRPDGVSLLRMVEAPEGDITDLVAAELAKSLHLMGLPFTEIDEENIPQDKTFRDAWVAEGNKIEVNMEKARKIHMDRIRIFRNAKLSHFDIEAMMGYDVQGQKQVLRDLPQTFDLADFETPEELKTAWPKELQ